MITILSNKNISDYLEGYGIRPSVQRLAIMGYLLEKKSHPCVDEIYGALCDSIPTLSKTTVYNTLKLFIEKGAAIMLNINSEQSHYDGDVSAHAHIYCQGCHRIFDLPMPNISAIDDMSFRITDASIYYKGYCKNCCNKTE